jgi:hypothetical protein
MNEHYPTGTERVTAENFVRAVTDITFSRIVREVGLAAFNHHRNAPRMDNQPVIRMNQDTLYSMAIIDLSTPARLYIPDCGDRYVSAQIINQDHYSMEFLHTPGFHEITQERAGARYAAINIRLFVNIRDPEDLKAVHALQDQFLIEQDSTGAFDVPDWSYEGFERVRNALQPLVRHVRGIKNMFGRPEDVTPITHLVGAAVGWGGLPPIETIYTTYEPKPENADKVHALTIKDVPADAFWSVTMYNKLGFMEANAQNSQSFNNESAQKNPDGSVTIHLGPDDGARANYPNYLPSPGEGWNYLVRLYRPQEVALNGNWRFPEAQPVS